MTTNVYSMSISARATLNMHSLNNEGGEGNQIQTRMVDIVYHDDGEPRLINVNAISGDMFKHIQAEHLYRIAKGNLPLCAGCRIFDANRISADSDYETAIADETDAQAIDRMLTVCALDDMEGNLITAGNRSIPRKSVVEFGWAVGVPDTVTTENYFHVKYARERGEQAREEATGDERRKANLGQAIFHRPANSGEYAIVVHVEASRIGYNDITQTYGVADVDREVRYRALLESLLYTFVEPNGAMRSTQLPHLVNVRGALSYSTRVIPAPTVSPLNPDFETEIEKVSGALNGLHGGAVEIRRFENLSGFSAEMQTLIQETAPYSLAV
ncbi:MAG: hypothetical protein MAG451_00793 [Anaerolineales bacterium]|nr:hypothetical protein [Anaerolineales bacterium]